MGSAKLVRRSNSLAVLAGSGRNQENSQFLRSTAEFGQFCSRECVCFKRYLARLFQRCSRYGAALLTPLAFSLRGR